MNKIKCGYSTNVLELIIFKALQSIGISAAFSLGGGTISDLFIPAGKLKKIFFFFFKKIF